VVGYVMWSEHDVMVSYILCVMLGYVHGVMDYEIVWKLLIKSLNVCMFDYIILHIFVLVSPWVVKTQSFL
jgi:hypothetical protein